MKIPASVQDDYLDAIFKGALGNTSLHGGMYREYFQRLVQFAEAGYGKRLTAASSFEEAGLMERMRRNLGSFAGFKNQTTTEELRGLLYDASGNKRPWADFLKDGRALLARHDNTYLRAELATAQRAAQSAESWAVIQQRAFLYPNLRYETVGDERVREEHRQLDGAIYPVNHPFWDEYMPPNGFRCRCIVLQTDKEANDMQPDWQPDRGFRNNPGKTGELFEGAHPYYDTNPADAERVRLASEAERAAVERRRLGQVAQKYAGSTFALPQLPGQLKVDKDGLKRAFASQHDEMAIKNSLLAVLQYIMPRLQYHSASEGLYRYLLEFLDTQFYWVLQEAEGSKGAEWALHSIIDNLDE